MDILMCPVCGEKIISLSKEAYCKNNHHFDRAKQGYLNLLISQASSSSHHGDDKMMVSERRNFLEKGYYSQLRENIIKIICDIVSDSAVILDCGCGEGYYSSEIFTQLYSAGKDASMLCIDISKEAAKLMAKYKFPHETIIASAYELPVMPSVADMIIDIFAPVAEKEFLRVLKPGGYLVRVLPKEMHLYELKRAVYERPYLNPAVEHELPGYEFLKSCDVEYKIDIDNNRDILSLFKMTPYYYKTSVSDQKKLNDLSNISVTLSFEIVVNVKRGDT